MDCFMNFPLDKHPPPARPPGIKWFVDQCLNVVEVQGPVPGPVRCACTQRRSPTYMAPSTASSHSKGAQNTAKYPSSFFSFKITSKFCPYFLCQKFFPLLFSCLNSSRLISKTIPFILLLFNFRTPNSGPTSNPSQKKPVDLTFLHSYLPQ